MTREANSFDFLRLLAATFVLVSHGPGLWDGRNDHFADLTGLDSLGHVGVEMFFATSGYWVTASWRNAGGIVTFAANRALRIFPGLVACVLVTVFVFGPLSTTLDLRSYFASPVTWNYLGNAALSLRYELPGVFEGNAIAKAVNGSLWTLPIEVLAYVTLALLGLAHLLERRVAPLAALACLALYAGATTGAIGTAVAVPYFNALLGVDAAKFFMAFYIGASLRLNGERWQQPWAIVPLVIIAYLCARGPWAQAATAAAVAYASIVLGRRAWPVLHRLGRFGDFSYGMYLYAFPVQQMLAGPFRPDVSVAAYQSMCFAIVLAIAVVSWHGIEKTALRLKRRSVLGVNINRSHLEGNP